MPTNIAVIRQISAAWIAPLLDSDGNTISGSTPVDDRDTVIPFDFIQDAGPEWPAPEGASGTEFIEATAANGMLVQWNKETTVLDGVTGTVKTGGSTGGGHKLKFTSLQWGKTLASALPPLLGKLVLACIPIGENVTTSENGFFYLVGKLSGTISYDAAGEEVVAIALEITGTSWTSTGSTADTAIIAALGAITPVGKTVAVTPVALVSGDVTTLKAGEIVVK